jgi:ferredoxin-type protein NapH
MCQQACLEAAPMRTALGDVRKCDLCAGHQPPACVTACPNGALSFDAGKKAKWIGWVRWPVQICSFLLLVMVLVGSVCSLSIAALDIACPTGVAQNILSSRTLLLTTLASAGLLALAAILLGRGFCGWVCPFGLCLDIVDRLAPRAFRLPAWLGNRLNKYGALAGALAASAGSGTQAFCAVCPIGTVCRSYGVQSTLGGAEIAMVPLVAALDLAGKRTWCRYFCPVGAVFAIFARLSPLTVRINGRRCRKFSCKRCAEVCPMGIIAAADLEDGRAPRISRAECINCLRCVDVCPYKAARVRLALPRIPFLTGSPKKQPAGEPCSQVRTS